MPGANTHKRTRERGAVLIGVIFTVLIGMVLVAGIGRFVASHRARVVADQNYAAALDMAEAGVNYEFWKITADPRAADQYPGTTYYWGNGTFRVYCAGDLQGTTPWPPATNPIPNTCVVFCTGTVDGVSRTVRVTSRGINVQGDYAVYGIRSLNLGGNVTIIGDVGTNGIVTNDGSCVVQGVVYCNGSGASYSGPATTTVYNPDPYPWPTVDQIVNEKFPQGGWTYLLANNDNATVSSPNFTGTTINGDVTLTGKPGGSNYYVTAVNLSGSNQVTFHNAGGPINIFIGPSGGTGTISFRGTTDGTTDTTQGGFQVNIYVATRGGINLTMVGTSSLRANVYAYNGTPGDYYGSVNYKGTPDIYGTVLGYDVTLGGIPEVHYVVGSYQPEADGYYGYFDSYYELNMRKH